MVVERDTSLLEVQRRSVCIAQISHATVKVTERCRCIYGGVQCGHAARVPRDKKTVGARTTGMHERVRHRSLHLNTLSCTAGRRLSTHSNDFEQRNTKERAGEGGDRPIAERRRDAAGPPSDGSSGHISHRNGCTDDALLMVHHIDGGGRIAQPSHRCVACTERLHAMTWRCV